MRLPQLDDGHTVGTRVLLAVLRLLGGGHLPDILSLVKYRAEFFGDPYCALIQELLRGVSVWSVGERELFAAWVAQVERCRFCLRSHGAVAALTLGEGTVEAVLAREWDTLPERIVATLTFLEKLTRSPESMVPADAARVYATGVTPAALEDAADIAAAFAIITRLADAFGFEQQTNEQVRASARSLLKRGYRL